MTCTKQISLTGYLVRHIDLREPKPRTIHEDVYVMDKDALAALGLMGLNVMDFITTRYERGGYHVIGIERIPKKRTATLDIRKIWQAAELSAEGREVTEND